jgi:hypothetical protein
MHTAKMHYRGAALVGALTAALFFPSCGPDKGKPFDVKNYRTEMVQDATRLPLSIDVVGRIYRDGTFEVLEYTVRGNEPKRRYVATKVVGKNIAYAGDNTVYAKSAEGLKSSGIGNNNVPPIRILIIHCKPPPPEPEPPAPTQLVRSNGSLGCSTNGCGEVQDPGKLEKAMRNVVGAVAKTATKK